MKRRSRIPNRAVWCDRGWFNNFFHYGFCPSEAAWQHEMKRLQLVSAYPKDHDGCCTRFKHGSDLVEIVTIGLDVEGSDVCTMTGLIAHEAAHVWQGLCERINEERPSEEMEAYGIQRIVEELTAAVIKTRGWPKRLT